MKAAVYSGSRNLYPDMVTAAKSLIYNSSVDKVYFMIEDGKFPEELPPIIETLNVSGQTYFPSDGANFRTQFTYMSLLRVCYSKLFPDLDKILQLDVDTIVVNNIDDLWNVDIDGKWFAACEETLGHYHPYGPKYYNVGVAMFNLNQIREDRIDDRLISFLNKNSVPYIDQDAWNGFGNIDRDVKLPMRFNESPVTGYTEEPAIIHWDSIHDWQNSVSAPRREYLKKYREMTWEEALRGKDTGRRSNV